MSAEASPGLVETPIVAREALPKRIATRVGVIIVGLALLSALATFLLLSGLTPVVPTNDAVFLVLLLNFVFLLALFGVVAVEVAALRRARRAGAAGSRLHGRMVRWFIFIAGMPAVLVAVVASFTLARGLDDWLNQPIKSLMVQTVAIAEKYRDAQCNMLGREGRLLAADLDRAKVMFDADRGLFRQFMNSRAGFLGIPVATIFDKDRMPIERAELRAVPGVAAPSSDDLNAVKETGDGICLVTGAPDVISGLMPMSNFNGAVLQVVRRVDPDALDFPRRAQAGVALYEALERLRPRVITAFATMYALISFIVLLSAVWMGLSFANSLATPVRRLIQATDQVASGNYYVQVPTADAEADLGHLGATFNKMTVRLRQQHDRLSAAADQIDRRRRFTEAVLSGVSVGVIGLDAEGLITVANPSAERIVGRNAGSLVGQRLADIAPEIAPLLAEAGEGRARTVNGQIELRVGGHERQINVRVTGDQAGGDAAGFVATLDDITDFVAAQRTSAWADVARRIAHEIKNPLTPIQLSAERIKRKYGRVITEDRAIFDQCTDTIIRQVDDIRRMVDEFSSFARMPKPTLDRVDIVEIVRQVVFLLRVGNPQIEFVERLPAHPVHAQADRRLLGQALTNLVKNATESIAAVAGEGRGPGRIAVTISDDTQPGTIGIDIADNGKGFPAENRNRLLEPYMTTREGGTGLGLAIVSKILEDHNGAITLYDNPEGEGALVRLTLPAIAADAAELADERAHA